MTETFKCPSCSAPLEFEGKMTQKCKFCGSSVIVPAQMFYQAKSENFTDFSSFDFSTFDLSALTGKASKIAEIQRLLQAGQKIQAIKVFRETFGTGLKEAKDAVDALERGESIDISGMKVQTSSRTHQVQTFDARDVQNFKRTGLAVGGSIFGTVAIIALIIIAFVGGILFLTFRSVSKTIDKVTDFGPPKQKSVTAKKSIATEVLRFGEEGLGAGKFEDNRTVAVDKDGNIYSADFSGGRIQSFDANGKFQLQMTGNTARSVNALALDRKGNLFALQNFEVYKFDAKTGEQTGKFSVETANDLAVGLNGKVYVANYYDTIQVFDANGAKQPPIKLAKELNISRIEKIEVDAGGNVFVLDSGNYTISKISPEGKLLMRFGGIKKSSTNKNDNFRARAMAVDSQGRIFLSDLSNIFIYDVGGNFIDSFESRQTFDLTFNDKDELFTASRPNVVKYTLNFE
ncbi:MAG TPA: ribosomal protein L7/L12 [Pyrinomonadaceae bacterium]|nr:ribosomal protein L7/L12 [Pyrinomonadaceae bacterium]